MTTWNYRVVRRVVPDHPEVPVFEIREVYYNDAGKPCGFTESPADPMGETLDELRNDLTHMLRALDAPVLDYACLADEVKQNGWDRREEPGSTDTFVPLEDVKAELGS